jgi:hypothetical protein
VLLLLQLLTYVISGHSFGYVSLCIVMPHVSYTLKQVFTYDTLVRTFCGCARNPYVTAGNISGTDCDPLGFVRDLLACSARFIDSASSQSLGGKSGRIIISVCACVCVRARANGKRTL